MSENGGFFKLWRKQLYGPLWLRPELLHLWLYCLREAAYRDHDDVVDQCKQPIRVLRGQLIIGRYKLNNELYPKPSKRNPSPSTTWRWLRILENMGFLNIETNSTFSLVTVLEYDTYQSQPKPNEQAFEQRANSGRTADEHGKNKEEEEKEDDLKEDKEISPTTKSTEKEQKYYGREVKIIA